MLLLPVPSQRQIISDWCIEAKMFLLVAHALGLRVSGGSTTIHELQSGMHGRCYFFLMRISRTQGIISTNLRACRRTLHENAKIFQPYEKNTHKLNIFLRTVDAAMTLHTIERLCE